MFKDENEKTVADLAKNGDLFVAARGGAGGHGNHFYLTNEDRAPLTYEVGGVGEQRLLFAELRIMAHVGLVSVHGGRKTPCNIQVTSPYIYSI